MTAIIAATSATDRTRTIDVELLNRVAIELRPEGVM
jgi:hypothetical protein